MKTVDRWLQQWRIAKIRRYLPPVARVLDIGCADGALARTVGELHDYVGLDPGLDASRPLPRGMLIKGCFPGDLPPSASAFDCITMLAVLEHIPLAAQAALAADCWRYLRPGGLVLITVPAPAVDYLLALLKALRVIDGMSLEEHYGFDVRQVPGCFAGAAFELVEHRRFQLGLNHLFVFRKPSP
ncbi:MAG TPA: class I SAM-dependent methyltransferase [Pirellulales bacterium]|nr:class I SAM-dependent methyltransferase [Pirellulales bacterium]